MNESRMVHVTSVLDLWKVVDNLTRLKPSAGNANRARSAALDG